MIYYKEWAHVIMETEKSCHLPTTSWRPRKSSGTILVQVQRPENQGADGVNPNPRTGEDCCPSLSRQGLAPPFLHFLFYSGPQQMG